MRTLVLSGNDPSEALMRMDALVETIEGAQFSTCTCVFIDPAREQLTYSTAGHPPPLVLTVVGEPRLLDEAQGVPLGFRAGIVRRSATTPLATGSRLVRSPDGLVERRSESLDVGFARLSDAALASRRLPLETLQEQVVATSFADYEQQDDVAMICAELVSPSRTRFARSIEPDPIELAPVRRGLSHWLRAGGTAPDVCRDIVLAISEALANAIEHGTSGRAHVELDVERDDDRMVATVRDHGHWRDGLPDHTRGRGLHIMEALSRRVEVDHLDGGTRVSLLMPTGGQDGG
jgi:anti-sigma regulatory factor (Ser/Thr protein kinase)